MPEFNFAFTVNAPLQQVSQFHGDTSALKKLTPPPIIVQVHRVEPLGEGSRAEFTLWAGPLPIRWAAVHREVSVNGFTDIQERGPMQRWEHTHRFTALSERTTQINEHIEYAHHGGLRGLFSRLLFMRPGLYMLFTARKILTRWHLRGGNSD